MKILNIISGLFIIYLLIFWYQTHQADKYMEPQVTSSLARLEQKTEALMKLDLEGQPPDYCDIIAIGDVNTTAAPTNDTGYDIMCIGHRNCSLTEDVPNTGTYNITKTGNN